MFPVLRTFRLSLDIPTATTESRKLKTPLDLRHERRYSIGLIARLENGMDLEDPTRYCGTLLLKYVELTAEQKIAAMDAHRMVGQWYSPGLQIVERTLDPVIGSLCGKRFGKEGRVKTGPVFLPDDDHWKKPVFIVGQTDRSRIDASIRREGVYVRVEAFGRGTYKVVSGIVDAILEACTLSGVKTELMPRDFDLVEMIKAARGARC